MWVIMKKMLLGFLLITEQRRCENDYTDGILWNITHAGKMSSIPCPSYQTGSVCLVTRYIIFLHHSTLWINNCFGRFVIKVYKLIAASSS